MGDPGQLEQTLMNICINARDAMPGGGKVTIETGNATLGESHVQNQSIVRTGPYVMLAISDTGEGMSEETKSRLFDPFFTTKEKGKGTGLGLSVVHGIVLDHDGEITVESLPERGTTFSVYLPHGGDVVKEKPEGDKSAPVGGKGSILFVDDEEDIVFMAREMLQSIGYDVTAMTSNTEALAAARRRRSGRCRTAILQRG